MEILFGKREKIKVTFLHSKLFFLQSTWNVPRLASYKDGDYIEVCSNKQYGAI